MDVRTHAGCTWYPCDLDLWPFDPRVNARQATAIETMCTSSVLIARSILLLERGQTNRHTYATERPTHAGGCIAGMGNKEKL